MTEVAKTDKIAKKNIGCWNCKMDNLCEFSVSSQSCTFKMAAMKLFHAEKCCHLMSA